MDISIVDLFLVIIIGAFVAYGAFFGFVHTLGNLVGSVVAILVATRFINPAHEWLGFIFGQGVFGKIILFIIIFLIITKLVGLVFYLVGKVWSVFKWLPMVGSLDRLLGLVLGFIEGVIVVGVILFFALVYLPEGDVRMALETSIVSKYLLGVADALKFMYPAAWSEMKEAQEVITS